MLRCVIVGVLALWAIAAPVRAQKLREQIRQLFTFGTCGELICLDPSLAGFHGLHFIPAAETGGATFISFLSTSIGVSVSNTPISSSSSGTTFKFEGGVPVKTSTSAGPIFAERAQTLGRGRWFVGLGVTHMNFERLRGVPLRDITFNFTHEDVDPIDSLGDPGFENDFISVKVAMDVSLLVTSFSLSYGLVDGIDLGVTVPFVRASVQGNSLAQFVPAGGSIVHFFSGSPSNPVLTAVSSAQGAATGLGDVAARLKINVAQTGRIGIAVLGDARFPTGDEANLLGAGAFSGRGLAIISGRFGNFSPHLNLGYTVRDAKEQNNSVDGTAGYDVLLSPWATMVFDVLGSWQIGASKLTVPPAVIFQAPARRSFDVTNIPGQSDDYMSLNIGFKFATRRGIQIVTSALFPLRDSGLQPSVAWTGGLEYNF